MKEVVFGITGSIAAYKAVDIISELNKKGIGVNCVLTNAGREFITKRTLEVISNRQVVDDMFPKEIPGWDVEHVSLAKKADLVVIAPATANIIAKIAAGIADDFLTTCVLATEAPILIAPAMNSVMYKNPITQKNLAFLKTMNMEIIEPTVGRLACGESGVGRFPDKEIILNAILKKI